MQFLIQLVEQLADKLIETPRQTLTQQLGESTSHGARQEGADARA